MKITITVTQVSYTWNTGLTMSESRRLRLEESCLCLVAIYYCHVGNRGYLSVTARLPGKGGNQGWGRGWGRGWGGRGYGGIWGWRPTGEQLEHSAVFATGSLLPELLPHDCLRWVKLKLDNQLSYIKNGSGSLLWRGKLLEISTWWNCCFLYLFQQGSLSSL